MKHILKQNCLCVNRTLVDINIFRQSLNGLSAKPSAIPEFGLAVMQLPVRWVSVKVSLVSKNSWKISLTFLLQKKKNIPCWIYGSNNLVFLIELIFFLLKTSFKSLWQPAWEINADWSFPLQISAFNFLSFQLKGAWKMLWAYYF